MCFISVSEQTECSGLSTYEFIVRRRNLQSSRQLQEEVSNERLPMERHLSTLSQFSRNIQQSSSSLNRRHDQEEEDGSKKVAEDKQVKWLSRLMEILSRSSCCASSSDKKILEDECRDQMESRVIRTRKGSTNTVLLNSKPSTTTPERMIADNFFANKRNNPSIAFTVASGDSKTADRTRKVSPSISRVLPLRDSSSSRKMQSVDENRLGSIRGTNHVANTEDASRDDSNTSPTLEQVSSMYESHGNVYLGSPFKQLSKEVLFKRTKTISELDPRILSQSPLAKTAIPVSARMITNDPLEKVHSMTNGNNIKNAHNSNIMPKKKNLSESDYPASNGIKSDKKTSFLPISLLAKHTSMEQLLEQKRSVASESSCEKTKDLRPSNPWLEEQQQDSKSKVPRNDDEHFDHGQDLLVVDKNAQDLLVLNKTDNKRLNETKNRFRVGSSSSISSSTYHGQNNNKNNMVSLVSQDILTPPSSTMNERNISIENNSSLSKPLSKSRNSQRLLLRQKSVEQIQAKQTQHMLNMTATPQIMEELDVGNLLEGRLRRSSSITDCDNSLFSDDNEISFRSALPGQEEEEIRSDTNARHKQCEKSSSPSHELVSGDYPSSPSSRSCSQSRRGSQTTMTNEQQDRLQGKKESEVGLTKEIWIPFPNSSQGVLHPQLSSQREGLEDGYRHQLPESSSLDQNSVHSSVHSSESYSNFMILNTNKEKIQLNY